MKKTIAMILICFIISSLLIGCANQAVTQETTSQITAIGNPWSDWETLKEAEDTVGFSFGLPEIIADSYEAVAFRTLNGELIEVIYQDEDLEVRVRKQKGEGQDISGDYTDYETVTEGQFGDGLITTYHNSGDHAVKQTISAHEYSLSLTAPNGYWGDSNADFLNAILDGMK